MLFVKAKKHLTFNFKPFSTYTLKEIGKNYF